MRNAVKTGFFTGIFISAILIGGTYLRRLLPDTFTANLLFLTLFFGSIVATLWYSLNYYCKTSAVKWMSLNVTGIISSIIAALLVSFHGFLYSRFKDPGYFDEIMKMPDQGFAKRNDIQQSFMGEWTWFQTPVNYALNNFRDLMVVLFILSLAIAAIFYIRNRNRLPENDHHKNQELIF